jgi:hypothetical protein
MSETSYVRHNLKSINVKYESNNVIVEAEQNFDIIKKTMARFYSLE